MLLELIREIGIEPIKTSSCRGGEYHSCCPDCGGKDRFVIWPFIDKYWCRQCRKSGDAIQFCRDFMDLDFKSACIKLGLEKKRINTDFHQSSPKFTPRPAVKPQEYWQSKAAEFVFTSHQYLLNTPYAMTLLGDRGFTVESMKKYSMGWNPENLFLPFPKWGLPIAYSQEGKEKKLWLPNGLVIPTFSNRRITKLKIRRDAWKEGDKLPKYAEIPGSMKAPAIYGNIELKVIVLVEAEFDAMLIQQFASDLVCSIAIGGAGKKPDIDTDRFLRSAKVILYSLDFDDAGRKAFQFWKDTYSNLKAWPAPKGKSPESSLKEGVDLRKWIESGIKK